jgi:hypothetical protein
MPARSLSWARLVERTAGQPELDQLRQNLGCWPIFLGRDCINPRRGLWREPYRLKLGPLFGINYQSSLFGDEAMGKRVADMTPEEHELVKTKARELAAKRRANDPEYRERLNAKERERYAKMSPEKHEQVKAKKRERAREWLANLTAEEREQVRVYGRGWRANMSREQRERINAGHRKRRAKWSPEERR